MLWIYFLGQRGVSFRNFYFVFPSNIALIHQNEVQTAKHVDLIKKFGRGQMAQRRSADPVGPLPHHATCGQNSIYYMASTCPYSDRGRSLGCFRCLDLNFISDPVSSNSGGVWVVHSFPNAVTHKRLWIPLQKDWENQRCAYVK